MESVDIFADIRTGPSFFALKDMGISPLARNIFGVFVELSCRGQRIYVCRPALAKLLRCNEVYVSTAVTLLVKKGLIKRTGTFVNVLYPEIGFTELGEQFRSSYAPA